MFDCVCPEFNPSQDNGCIYLYEFDNGMRYIGQTIQTLQERHRGHMRVSKQRSEQFVDRFIRTHKWKLSIIWVGNKTELTKKENEYILKYNTLWPNGYNLHLEDELYSASKVYVDGIHPLSKKVHLYDKQGLYITSFNSISQAQSYLKIDTGNASKQQNGKRLIGKKYYLRHDSLVFLSILKPPVQKKARQKQVCQIDPKTGLIINTYQGCREAHRQTGVDSSQIVSCCKKTGYRLSGGYMWAYADSIQNIKPLGEEGIVSTSQGLKSKRTNYKIYHAINEQTGESIEGTQHNIQNRFDVDVSQIVRRKYQDKIHKKGKLKGWRINQL